VASILIVDDETTIRTSLRLVLQSVGYKVATASSAREATELLARQYFDMVLTDVRMETPTAGFEVLRSARRHHPSIPVALLTGFPITTSDWKQAGADALFVKGSGSPIEMLEWIHRILDVRANPEGSRNLPQQAKKHAR
jgi:DNA-binding NtrC family response regulator